MKYFLALSFVFFFGCDADVAPMPNPGPQPVITDKSVIESTIESADGMLLGRPIVEVWTGTETKVIDGETIQVVAQSKESVTVNLDSVGGLDPDHPLAEMGISFLKRFAENETVTVAVTGANSNGESVAIVVCNGVFLNDLMLRHGFAHHQTTTGSSDELEDAQWTAKGLNRGVWANENK